MSKNVDLIIRLKDEAQKSLTVLTSALSDFSGEAKEVAGSTGKLDSSLSRLKTEASALGTQINNLAGVSKVVTNFDKMTASVERMDVALTKNSADLAQRKKDLETAAFAEARIASATAATVKILEAQTAAMKAAKTEAVAETAEVDKLTRALERMNVVKTVRPASTTSATALNKAESKFSEDHSALSNTKTEISSLQTALSKIKSSADNTLTEIEQRTLAVINKFNDPASGRGVNFSKLRAELADLSRAQQDTALKGLLAKNQFIPSQYSDPKSISKEEKAAIFSPAGEPFHLAYTNPNRPSVAGSGLSDAERAQMEAKLAKLETLKDRQVEALAKSQSRVEKAEKRIEDAEKKTAEKSAEQARTKLELQTKLEAAKPRQEAAQARLSTLTGQRDQTAADLAEYSAKGTAAAKVTTDLDRKVAGLTATLDRDSVSTARAKTELNEFGSVVQKVTAAAGVEAATLDAVTAAANRQAAALANARGRIEAKSGPNAIKAPTVVTDKASSFLKARSDRKAEMEEAGAEATRLGKALATADGPAEELAAAFGRAAEKSRIATQAFYDQSNALTKLSGKSTFAAFSQKVDADPGAAQRKAAEIQAVAAASAAAAQAQQRQETELAAAKARIDATTGRNAIKAPAVVTDSASGFLKARSDRKAEMEAAAAEATRLGRALAAADGPAEELAAAFGRAAEKSRIATQAYLDQYNALTKLSGKSSFAAFSQKVDASAAARPAPAAAAPPIGGLGIKEAGDAGEAGAKGIKSFSDALKGVYGDSRESLSLMQRLRGEVLALTASYVGFQAVIQGISKSVDAFRSLEAVENRLGAVFNQDTTRVANEVAYLKREADRLGISFSVLADQYGKFNIAANAANFTSQETRKVFMSVAEAARVNKLSNDQVNGVFLALTQMLSKGKIQAQELRQQLGDRLPGALQILQTALGLTASEMEDLMQKGELVANSSQLLKFADEMDKRFGPQLAASLRSTTTEIGRFQNNLEQVALAAANGGLIDGFTNLLRTLNTYFASTEGREFFMSLGAAAGRLMNGLAALVPYAQQLKWAFEGLIALKVAQLFFGLYNSLTPLVVATTRAVIGTNELSFAQRMASASALQLTTQTRLGQVAIELMGTTAGLTAGRVTFLSAAYGNMTRAVQIGSTAIRGAMSMLGGLPGLIIGGLTIAAGYWFTSVENVTEELSKHASIMSKIVQAYDQAKDKSGDWAKNVEGATKSELAASRARLQEQASTTRGKAVAPGSDFSDGIISGTLPLNARLTDLVERFNTGKIAAKDFVIEVDKLAQADPKLTPQIVEPLIKIGREAEKVEKALEENAVALKLVDNAASETERALIGTNDALKNNGFKQATVDTIKFNEAIDKLKAGIPALAIELKKMKDMAEAYSAAQAAVNAAGIPEGQEGSPDQRAAIQKATDLLQQRMSVIFDEETKALVKQFGGDKIPLSLTKIIAGSEGFPTNSEGKAPAYKDVGGKPTIGFGNTTYQDGSSVKMGDVITKAEAVKLLVDTLNGFAGMVDAAVGGAKLSENQRNALISYVYNVGNTNKSPATKAIFDALRANASPEEVANKIANGVATVDGVENSSLRKRRQSEAKLFLTPDDRAAGQDSGSTGYDVAKQNTETQLKGDKSIDDKVAQNLREAAAQKKINDADNQSAAKKEVEIEKVIGDERRKAAEEGREFSKEREAQLRSSTAALYDQMHVNDQAKEAEEKVNALYKTRQQLIEQMNVWKEQGNATELAASETAFKKINEEIRAATAEAIKMWQAIGGPEADLAIAKLKIIAITTEKNKTAILTAKQANEMLANGAVKAFTAVADSIGRAIVGTGKWKDVIKTMGTAFLQFAADFLREIGQMILKQLLLNALSSAMGVPGGVGGGVAGFVNGLVGKAHTGGVVGSRMTGSGNGLVAVNPAWFNDAARFHEGGIAGLAPNEVPTILKRNEEVLTENDPRHVMNGGKDAKGGAMQMPLLQQALLLDPNDIVNVLSSAAGQKAVITMIKTNKSTVKQILG